MTEIPGTSLKTTIFSLVLLKEYRYLFMDLEADQNKQSTLVVVVPSAECHRTTIICHVKEIKLMTGAKSVFYVLNVSSVL